MLRYIRCSCHRSASQQQFVQPGMCCAGVWSGIHISVRLPRIFETPPYIVARNAGAVQTYSYIFPSLLSYDDIMLYMYCTVRVLPLTPICYLRTPRGWVWPALVQESGESDDGDVERRPSRHDGFRPYAVGRAQAQAAPSAESKAGIYCCIAHVSYGGEYGILTFIWTTKCPY